MFDKLRTIVRMSKSIAQKDNAEVDLGGIIMAIIAVVVGGILISSLVPGSIESLETTNTTAWATGTASTYEAIPTLFAVAVLAIPIAIVIKLTK